MLPMNGGGGENSYAKNSLLQEKVISMTWPITKEAITDLYYRTSPIVLTMADLGCSSGPNAFMVVSNLIKQVEKIRGELHNNSVEYQIFLNDLPENDFNAIFKALPSFLEDLKTQTKTTDLGPFLFNGVPGSFYGRLFPSKTVHFVHSSYSLHWLSQVPEGLESNKGNIFISGTSPGSVLEAYYKQYRKDFSMFLKHRAEELISGGRMVLTIIGRTSEDRSSKECCYIWELLTLALNDMVTEGSIEEEKVDSFNLPVYMPSPSEVKAEVFGEGSFTINRLQASRIDWNCYNSESNTSNELVDSAQNMANCIRAVVEPLLVRHFGATIIDELFYRFKEIVTDRMSKERTAFVNLTISLTKK